MVNIDLTSFYQHTQITTKYRASIDEKHLKTIEKIFYSRNHNESYKKVEIQCCQDLNPWVGDHKWENNFNFRGSSEV